jgi:hypothetical protein
VPVLVASALALALAASPAPLPFEPGDPEPGVERRGETWTQAKGGYVATLERLDDAARWAFLRAHSKAVVDPFATSAGVGFVTFRFALESRAAGTLVFDAGSCRLVTQDKTTRYPLDLPTIESAYGLHDKEIPPAYLTIRGALFDSTLFLEQGQRAEGLLVFQNVPERTRAFSVEVVLTTQGGEQGRFTAGYKRPRKARR